jgi:hypothetical protein
MAKRKIYNWERIKAEYELGKPQAYLVKKYDIPFSTLSTKIKKDKWRVSEVEVNAIKGFSEATEVVSEVIANKENTPEKVEALVELVDTTLEDNALRINNRKLASMAQGVLLKNKDNFNHTNIKNLTGAIRDIEAIANPQPKSQGNVQQSNTTQVAIMSSKEKREMFLKRKAEILGG